MSVTEDDAAASALAEPTFSRSRSCAALPHPTASFCRFLAEPFVSLTELPHPVSRRTSRAYTVAVRGAERLHRELVALRAEIRYEWTPQLPLGAPPLAGRQAERYPGTNK